MTTLAVTLSVPALEHDRYVGLLSDRATGFHQTDATLTAYVPADAWSLTVREALRAHLRADGYDRALSVEPVSPQNWNATWEQTIAPLRVGSFLLCPTDAEAPDRPADVTLLRVDPEQSFGTGHHATTRLALRLLEESVTPGARVVDWGTGTGVLAIAACHLGARSVLGVDTDPTAVENARANVVRNEVADYVDIRAGSADAVPESPVDVIVANLTRGTLLDLLPALRDRLTASGTLILSGLLTSQEAQIRDVLPDHGLTVDRAYTEDGWWAARTRPTGAD